MCQVLNGLRCCEGCRQQPKHGGHVSVLVVHLGLIRCVCSVGRTGSLVCGVCVCESYKYLTGPDAGQGLLTQP